MLVLVWGAVGQGVKRGLLPVLAFKMLVLVWGEVGQGVKSRSPKYISFRAGGGQARGQTAVS